MTEYLLFHETFLGSLEYARAAYDKANEMDLLNDGTDFDYSSAYMAISNYVIKRELSYKDIRGVGMEEFIGILLESVYEDKLLEPENILEPLAKDFGKKSFLIMMASRIMEKILV